MFTSCFPSSPQSCLLRHFRFYEVSSLLAWENHPPVSLHPLQETLYVWNEPKLCTKGAPLPARTSVPCEAIALWLKVGVGGGAFVAVLLISLTCYFWKKNKRWEAAAGQTPAPVSGKIIILIIVGLIGMNVSGSDLQQMIILIIDLPGDYFLDLSITNLIYELSISASPTSRWCHQTSCFIFSLKPEDIQFIGK